MNHPSFSIIYADPPWHFKPRGAANRTPSANSANRPVARRTLPYPAMDTHAIGVLPVDDICVRDSVLSLWATYFLLPQAFSVIDAWGFKFKTVAFTWVKRTPSDKAFHFGICYWTRANPELCLLATRGHPHRCTNRIPNLVIAPVRDHSRKPDVIREQIVTLCGDLPRAELFAREKTAGWSV